MRTLLQNVTDIQTKVSQKGFPCFTKNSIFAVQSWAMFTCQPLDEALSFIRFKRIHFLAQKKHISDEVFAMYYFIFSCQWDNPNLATEWSENSEDTDWIWQRPDPAAWPIKGNNKKCPVRPWKSNANVCQKQVLKSSVKPDSPCGCSPPSGRSPPEMNTGTFLERTLSVQAMATGLHHPSGLCQSNFNSSNSMKFSNKLFASCYMRK